MAPTSDGCLGMLWTPFPSESIPGPHPVASCTCTQPRSLSPMDKGPVNLWTFYLGRKAQRWNQLMELDCVSELWWKRLILLWKEKKNIQSCLVFYEFIKQIFLMFLSFLFVSDVVTLYIFFFFNYRLITLVSNSATIEPVLWECCRLHIYNVEWKARWEMVCYSDDRRCT